jgi:hypothetical protein
MISKENYIAQEKVLADDINLLAKNSNDAGGFRDDIDAGESITAFRPVFLDSVSGSWKFCDADDTDRIRFDGFALEAGTNGDPLAVQLSGIVRGFSSLTLGVKYYVQDDGTIGTAVGTYNILVGEAVGATELLISKIDAILPAVDGSELTGLFAFNTLASANIRSSNDTARTTNSTSFIKLKEIRLDENILGASKTIRISFAGRPIGAVAEIAIYKNGVATGYSWTFSGSLETKTADISNFVEGDLIQLYVRNTSGGGNLSEVSNFRLQYDVSVVSIVGAVLATPLATTKVYATTNTLT